MYFLKKSKILKIARQNLPEQVVELEEEWGNMLFAQGNFDVAINHFLGISHTIYARFVAIKFGFSESGNTWRAVDSSIRAKDWDRALDVLRVLEPSEETVPFYQKIAQHFEQERQYDVSSIFQFSNRQTNLNVV